MAVTWGSTVGSYGRIGINVTTSSTATTTSVSATVYFWSKYTVSDTTNTLYFNYGATSATTSQGSKSIKTTSNSGSGWSTTNQIAIGTYTASYARGTSAKTVYCAAKLSGVDVVGGTMTHYVAFTVPALDSYAVTYNANGGTGAPSNQTKWYGTNITLSSSEPTRTGYTFKGWATSSSGSVAYSPGASYTANAAVTLYAVWQIITYKVTYNANGGTGAPTAQTKNHGTALTLSTGKPTRANYNFLGWSASATGTVAYAPGASYTANAAVTLYAVWELAYYVPSITNTTIYRCTADGTLSETGTYYYLKFDWECCQLLGNNPVQSATVYRSVNIPPMTGGSSLNVGTTATSGTYVPINALGAGGCDPDKMYYVRICVTDSMGGVGTKVLILNKAKFIIDIKAGGDGISFGGPAARAGADFFMDAFFNKKIYDDYGRRINNGLAVYEAGGQTDPNTTLDELILTEKGTPAAGMFFYIQTYFFAEKSSTTARAQTAIPYDQNGSMYHRYYFNGSWSAWRRHLNADELPKDYIVEQGVSGDWYYDKYASGKIEITNSSAWAFTSGYTYITPPDVCEFIRTKPTIIIATGRYRGDNRTPGLVFTPSEPATKSFSMYGRNGTIAVTGTHYVDLVIKGFWK